MMITEILTVLLEELAPYILVFIDIVLTSLELRMCINFFLNINPFFEPFLTLWVFTDVFMWTGRGIYPRIFGMDITSMINYRLIIKIKKSLEYFVYYQKSHKMGIDENDLLSNKLTELFNNNHNLEHFLNQDNFHQFLLQTDHFLNNIGKNI